MTWRRAAAVGAGAGTAVLALRWYRGRRRHTSGRAPDAAPLVDPRYRAGSGSPLLLVHGVGGTWHAWDPVLSLLSSHHDVLAPSLLGHGGADPLAPGVRATVDSLVDGLEAELDRAGMDQVHVVGNSLGGWLAIELARRGRARSLVLFSPAGAWTSQRRINVVALSIRLSVAVLSRQAAHADRIVAIPWLRRALLSTQVAHPERVDPQSLAANIRASAHAPAVDLLLRELPHLHLDPLPADSARPVRVVWAQPDRVIPFEWFGAPLVERLPGAELIRQPGIGHVPMSDEPATVARLILEVTTAADGAEPGAEPGSEPRRATR
jgi:pimeloyl-ACP methyl ester carboxylesterase